MTVPTGSYAKIEFPPTIGHDLVKRYRIAKLIDRRVIKITAANMTDAKVSKFLTLIK